MPSDCECAVGLRGPVLPPNHSYIAQGFPRQGVRNIRSVPSIGAAHNTRLPDPHERAQRVIGNIMRDHRLPDLVGLNKPWGDNRWAASLCTGCKQTMETN